MDASNSEDTERDETEKERLDRNLEQLLGELRVALPGVQVLFAFLLVVPFNQRFADITSFQQTVYFVTLLCATAACACLIAPTAHHRIEFREQDKERIVLGGNRLAIVGLTLLATRDDRARSRSSRTSSTARPPRRSRPCSSPCSSRRSGTGSRSGGSPRTASGG